MGGDARARVCELVGRTPKKLIEWVVACVDEGMPPPPELQTAWDVRTWGALPEAGGLYDQDYVLLRRMTALLGYHQSLSAFRNMKGKDIHHLSDAQRRVIKYLRGEGMI